MKERENKSGLEKRRQRRKQGVQREAERKRFRKGEQAKQPVGERQGVAGLWLLLFDFIFCCLHLLVSPKVPLSASLAQTLRLEETSVLLLMSLSLHGLPTFCWSKKILSMSRKYFYSLPLSTCCPSYRGLMFQWPWCGHTGRIFFKYFDWLQRIK